MQDQSPPTVPVRRRSISVEGVDSGKGAMPGRSKSSFLPGTNQRRSDRSCLKSWSFGGSAVLPSIDATISGGRHSGPTHNTIGSKSGASLNSAFDISGRCVDLSCSISAALNELSHSLSLGEPTTTSLSPMVSKEDHHENETSSNQRNHFHSSCASLIDKIRALQSKQNGLVSEMAMRIDQQERTLREKNAEIDLLRSQQAQNLRKDYTKLDPSTSCMPDEIEPQLAKSRKIDRWQVTEPGLPRPQACQPGSPTRQSRIHLRDPRMSPKRPIRKARTSERSDQCHYEYVKPIGETKRRHSTSDIFAWEMLQDFDDESVDSDANIPGLDESASCDDPPFRLSPKRTYMSKTFAITTDQVFENGGASMEGGQNWSDHRIPSHRQSRKENHLSRSVSNDSRYLSSRLERNEKLIFRSIGTVETSACISEASGNPLAPL
jgi:hypothetical protein